MSSARNRAARALLVAAGLALGAGTAQAQSIVVRSSGPSAASYPLGKRLPVNAKVVLRAGDKLTVLDKAGSRVLSGPGNYTLDGAVARDTGAATRVAGVVGAGAPRTRTGAVRGAKPAGPATATATIRTSGPDSIWYVDVSRGGTYCVADPAQVVLWRPNSTEQATGKLTPAGGKAVEVEWKKGNPLKLWPSSLPVSEGARYAFSDPVGPTVPITFRLLGAVPADDLAVAGMLADKGCTAQLDVYANAATPLVGG